MEYNPKRDKVLALLNKINIARGTRDWDKVQAGEKPDRTPITELEVERMIRAYAVEHGVQFIEGAKQLSYIVSQRIQKGEWV